MAFKKSIGIRYRRLLEKRYRYSYSVLKKWYRDNPSLDVNVNGVQRHSRTSYAKQRDFLNFDAGTTAILNMA